MAIESPLNNGVRRTCRSIEEADMVYPMNSSSETAWMRIPGQYELNSDTLQSLSPCRMATMETPSRMSCQRRLG